MYLLIPNKQKKREINKEKLTLIVFLYKYLELCCLIFVCFNCVVVPILLDIIHLCITLAPESNATMWLVEQAVLFTLTQPQRDPYQRMEDLEETKTLDSKPSSIENVLSQIISKTNSSQSRDQPIISSNVKV